MIYFDEAEYALTNERSEFDSIIQHEDCEFVGEPCRIEDRTTSTLHLGVVLKGDPKVHMIPGSWVADRYRKPTETELESELAGALFEGNHAFAVDLMIALTESYTAQKVTLTAPALNEIERVVA